MNFLTFSKRWIFLSKINVCHFWQRYKCLVVVLTPMLELQQQRLQSANDLIDFQINDPCLSWPSSFQLLLDSFNYLQLERKRWKREREIQKIQIDLFGVQRSATAAAAAASVALAAASISQLLLLPSVLFVAGLWKRARCSRNWAEDKHPRELLKNKGLK